MQSVNLPADADDLSVQQYWAMVANSKPLSREEEVKIAARIQAGDDEARNQLVEANLRFAFSVAKNYQNRGLPLSDLISAGNLGLLTAAERFDGTKGFKFISYAVWWIRQAILQAIAEQGRTVRLPLNRIGLLKDISKATRKLGQGSEKDPDLEAIAAELGLSVAEIEETLLAGRSMRYLDQQFGEDDERSLMNSLSDPDQELPDALVIGQTLSDQIERALECLDKRNRYIIVRYFGLDGEEAWTLDELGAHFGLTRERIRQLKERALEKLRHPSRSDRLRSEHDPDFVNRPRVLVPQVPGKSPPAPVFITNGQEDNTRLEKLLAKISSHLGRFMDQPQLDFLLAIYERKFPRRVEIFRMFYHRQMHSEAIVLALSLPNKQVVYGAVNDVREWLGQRARLEDLKGFVPVSVATGNGQVENGQPLATPDQEARILDAYYFLEKELEEFGESPTIKEVVAQSHESEELTAIVLRAKGLIT